MADMSAESIQQKIQIARRDAEALKDRIKRKKDELADTTRTSARQPRCPTRANQPLQSVMSPSSESRLCRVSP
jgi:guanine nucleotide-binding protein G(I)/G(S)/G(T) subunit beta-1